MLIFLGYTFYFFFTLKELVEIIIRALKKRNLKNGD